MLLAEVIIKTSKLFFEIFGVIVLSCLLVIVEGVSMIGFLANRLVMGSDDSKSKIMGMAIFGISVTGVLAFQRNKNTALISNVICSESSDSDNKDSDNYSSGDTGNGHLRVNTTRISTKSSTELESLLSGGEAMLLTQNDEITLAWEKIAELDDYLERHNEMVRNRDRHRGTFGSVLQQLMGGDTENPVYVQTLREQSIALDVHAGLIELKNTYPIPSAEDTRSSDAMRRFIHDSEEHHTKFKEMACLFLTQSQTFLRQNAVLAGEELPRVNIFERRI